MDKEKNGKSRNFFVLKLFLIILCGGDVKKSKKVDRKKNEYNDINILIY